MKKFLFFLSLSCFALSVYSQNVNIPDVNLKAYLVGNSLINTNLDTEIQVSEANSFTGKLNFSSYGVSDVTGIEAFTSLTGLNCSYNSITNLDLSLLTTLVVLECNNNSLTTLNLSLLPNLDTVACQNNSLTTFNLANGNNTGISFFNALVNPSLPCIIVDDAFYSQTNWTFIDGTSTFTSKVDNPVDVTVCENYTLPVLSVGDYYTGIGGTGSMLFAGNTINASQTIYIYKTNGSCFDENSFLVTINPIPIVDAGANITICENDSIQFNASGASTYSWSNAVPNLAYFAPTVGNQTFFVTGTDANGCVNVDSILVTVNSLPIVFAGNDTSICENQSISLFGTGANTYIWDNGVSNGVSFTPTVGVTTYNVTGTDLNACQVSDQISVTVNALPNVNAGNDTSICLNSTITLGGIGAFSYAWDNGVSDGISFSPSITSTYVLTGTDMNSCSANDTVVVTVIALPSVDAGANITICENDSIQFNASGANIYSWSNAVPNLAYFTPAVGNQTFFVTGTDANGCVNVDSMLVAVNSLPIVFAGNDTSICENQSISLFGAGANSYIWDNGVTNGVSFNPIVGVNTYNITGTDLNGCQVSDQINITVNALPNVNAGNDTSICLNSTITLGGTGAFSYTWDNGISDGVSFSPLSTSTYVLTGTSMNSCSANDTVVVTVNLLPIIEAGIDQNFCENSIVTLTATGAISYLWDNGVADGVGFTPISTGTYTVTGTDLNGCQNTDQVILTFVSLPTINTAGSVEICEFEEINISASSNSQFVFWFNQASGGQVISSGLNYFSDEIFSDSVIYVGAIENGCSSERLPYQITVNSKPTISLTPTNSDCGVNNGSISATISNGTLPYINYYWSTGEQNVMSVSNLTTGIYYFNVEDSKGCKALTATEIIPNSITINPTIVNPTCYNQNTGSINISVSGTNENLSFLWNTGHQTNGISNLRAGTYEVTINTESGCQFASSFALTQPNPIENEVLVIKPTCGNSDGQLAINQTTGGVANYLYAWDNGQNGTTNSNIPFGAYTLTTTDNIGCITQQTYYLSEQNAPNIVGSIIEASCNGNDGSIDAELTPQIGDIVTAISWSNGPTTEDISNLNPGNYICTATTQNNCNAIKGWNLTGLRPLKQEICLVSVDSVTTTNLIVWEKIQQTGVSYYNIYRESNQVDDYLLIDTVHFSNLSVFNDVVASPNVRSWRYRISAVDACGVESELSTSHKTLHLNTFDMGAPGVKITWDQYEGTIFSSYILWRYTDADGWIDIASLPTSTLNYTDNIAFTTSGLDYMVEISLDQPCTATIWRAQDFNRSRSNKEKGVFNPGVGNGEFSNNSIHQVSTENSLISVYPNPFENTISIDIEGKLPQSVFLMDINGKKLKELICTSDKSIFKMDDIENGVYFLTITDEKAQKVIKIVKN